MTLFSADINLIKIISAYEAKNNLFLKVNSSLDNFARLSSRNHTDS